MLYKILLKELIKSNEEVKDSNSHIVHIMLISDFN